MTTEDFKRLKAVCEKEGFTIESYCGGKTAIVGVKDPWQGVEFAECIKNLLCAFTEGKIYRILTEINQEECFIDDEGDINGLGLENKEYFKPSTESAYVEQLKKEAFQRFGEIKNGVCIKSLDDNIYTQWFTDARFFYYNEVDQLYFQDCLIYSKGKWAKRVKERVKVMFFQDSLDEHNKIEEWGYVFKIHNYRYGCEKSIESGQFLAKQLEQYLNNEIK